MKLMHGPLSGAARLATLRIIALAMRLRLWSRAMEWKNAMRHP